jgi:hypothetical protein
VKVGSSLSAELDDQLALDRSRRLRNEFGWTNIQYETWMALMALFNWYVSCRMFGFLVFKRSSAVPGGSLTGGDDMSDPDLFQI